MSRFLGMLQQAVKLYGGVRPTARLLGMSPATVSRLARGKPADPATAAVVCAAIGVCHCCGQGWPKDGPR